jgi:hypothetical protein
MVRPGRAIIVRGIHLIFDESQDRRIGGPIVSSRRTAGDHRPIRFAGRSTDDQFRLTKFSSRIPTPGRKNDRTACRH